VLTNLYTLTGNKEYLRYAVHIFQASAGVTSICWCYKLQKCLRRLHACRTADLFVKHTFFDPLANGQDVLEGRHANTCVPVRFVCWA
jgi:hypothetical protein